MILREIERRPMRSVLSSLGVAFSVAILVIGTFMFDAVTFMMDLQFRVIQREDLMVTFEEPLSRSVRYDLAAMPGVSRVEMYRSVPARLWAGHREREVAVQGLASGSRLRRIVSADGRIHPIPVEGLVLSDYLADALEVEAGDTVRVEVLEGERREADVLVAGVIEDFIGVSVTMDRATLERLAGGGRVASGAYLSVFEPDRPALESRLKDTPAVASVASPETLLDNFESQLADSLYISIGFLLGFAGVISVGIIYNGARISLSERGRELASLRVMGFRRGEVSVLLLGEQALVTLVAIPVGWGLGYLLSLAILSGLRTETYRIPLVIGPTTYLLSAGVTIAAAIASGWIVRRRIDTLDLIEVLKTRE
jgi:putative ABC transport system permease protein